MSTTEFQYLAQVVVRMTAAKNIYSQIDRDVQHSKWSNDFDTNLQLMLVDLDAQIQLALSRMRSMMRTAIQEAFPNEGQRFERECLRYIQVSAWGLIASKMPSQAARFYQYDTETVADKNTAGMSWEEQRRLEIAYRRIDGQIVMHLWRGIS